ncbi:hypothetical protein CsatA_004034 [Cannabis sativa]
MKFGLFDLKLKEPRNISFNSWQGIGSPYGGAFTLGVDPNNTQQLMIWQRGLPYWRSGNWNGKNFSYFPNSYYDDTNNIFKFDYISNEKESYFTYTTLTPYNNSYIEMNSTGGVSFYIAKPDAASISYGSACNDMSFGSKGCIKQNHTACSSGEDYFYMPRSGHMDSWDYPEDFSLLGLDDCRAICSKNCKCTAYMSATPDGTGCSFSYGKYVAESFWETFYVRDSAYDAVDDTTKNATRVAPKKSEKKFKRNTPAPILKGGTPRKRKNKNMIVIPLVSIAVLTLACSVGYIIWKKFYSKGKGGSNGKQVCGDTEKYIHELGTSMAAIDKGDGQNLLHGKIDPDLPLFSFCTIETATDFFSEANRLGQGGFGPVYKGVLDNGQEIAVKRLSVGSGQGQEEFKTEVVLISKVQHRNLVRLLGCCIKGVEKILIYEYLPNKSLDTFIFDETKRILLNWRMRVNIIEGIAQGLLYLHKYSRLKIIHRDLKCSNILLDNDMSPKISDFGTAKTFGDNESGANTCRIVGTYGYMSPEYAMDGLFSVKSDVFSFGVMMLEIISGKKCLGLYHPNQSINLVGYAWNLWKDGQSIELLLDAALAETCSTTELKRCVQIALLCVQESASDRPAMSEIVSMIGNDVGILPGPKQPGFYSNYSDTTESTILTYNSISADTTLTNTS